MMANGTRKIAKSLADIVALPAPRAAPLLLGSIVTSRHDDRVVTGIITELEAYTQDDAASHTFRGPTKRNAAMFGPPGHTYVYFTYGMHYCMNITCGPEGRGEAVLIRGIKIIDGVETAIARRYGQHAPTLAQLKNLSNGPGKVVQALGVSMSDYGSDLLDQSSTVFITPGKPVVPKLITQTPRIGISKNRETLWRWQLIQ